MTSPVFSAEEIQQFLDWGFVKASAVFPSEIAADCRRALDEKSQQGISVLNPDTWPKRVGLTEIYHESDGYPWSHVFTSRLNNAVDELCGKGRWDSFGCGWWVISFPSPSPSASFELEGHWHIDGSDFVHFPHSKEVGLVLIMLFSDILPNGGGTAVACGSHKVISKLIIQSGEKGMTSKEVASKVHMDKDFEVVGLTGQSGDVVFMHPHLLHARSKNNGPFAPSAIRYICHPTIPLKQPMRFTQPVEELSLVEQSILNEAAANDLEIVGSEDCERTMQTNDVSQDIMMDMESSLGIQSFGSSRQRRRR